MDIEEVEKPLLYLVDDDIEFCKLMAASFDNLGVEFIYFSTISDFISALKERIPAASLVDVNFGSENLGFQLIQQIKQQVSGTHPIFAVSGKKDVHSIGYALQLGADDYISKPVDVHFLVAKLAQYFNTEEMQAWYHPDVELAVGNNEATFVLNAKILGVDEMGFRFETLQGQDALIS